MNSVSIFPVNRQTRQELTNLLGATYAAILFLGGSNASAVQSVVAVERTVFYRERAAGMYSELPYAFAQVSKWKPILVLMSAYPFQDNIFVIYVAESWIKKKENLCWEQRVRIKKWAHSQTLIPHRGL